MPEAFSGRVAFFLIVHDNGQASCGMRCRATRFVNVDRDTALLLPPDLRDWVALRVSAGMSGRPAAHAAGYAGEVS